MKEHKSYDECFILGTGQFACQCALLLKKSARLDGVYEYKPYKQSGMGGWCKKKGIPYERLAQKEKADELIAHWEKEQKQILILSASNTYIFPASICKNPYVQIVNFHPGLFSAHLGRNAEAWSIFGQDKFSGITWHKVTSEIDRGAVLCQKEIALDERITSLRLIMLQHRLGLSALEEILPFIVEGSPIPEVPVTCCGSMHYAKDRPNNGVLDLSWDENKISAFLRSMDYGRLSIMGRPILWENKKQYTWQRYKISNPDDMISSSSADRVIKKGNKVFTLYGYHLLEK